MMRLNHKSHGCDKCSEGGREIVSYLQEDQSQEICQRVRIDSRLEGFLPMRTCVHARMCARVCVYMFVTVRMCVGEKEIRRKGGRDREKEKGARGRGMQ
jgi:hypothetical protein